MTGKEALERLVDGNLNEVNYYRQFCDSTTYIMKDKEIIKKDLEILEIIKKINKTDLLHFFAITIKNETEFNLIKEWLER